uniref:Uncharacterized protein n=1 Tax=Strongyloides papillosus TaxID=174720 RepID=A0A0N5C6W7_STREA
MFDSLLEEVEVLKRKKFLDKLEKCWAEEKNKLVESGHRRTQIGKRRSQSLNYEHIKISNRTNGMVDVYSSSIQSDNGTTLHDDSEASVYQIYKNMMNKPEFSKTHTGHNLTYQKSFTNKCLRGGIGCSYTLRNPEGLPNQIKEMFHNVFEKIKY